ncbi:hypothetical protein GWK47_017706 [Chionoecetes opilio]|uniref:Uncharacterized protein n=1 Tax=Chionoecetes opilio TaxID=41210 RepID=A0A8J5CJP6_CHIOP|nr:hypothetical protein GWK47_017706 [Chionoecetes opilio]
MCVVCEKINIYCVPLKTKTTCFDSEIGARRACVGAKWTKCVEKVEKTQQKRLQRRKRQRRWWREAASIRRSDSLQPGPTQQKMMSSAEPCGKKQYRWSLELLHTAVCGHRWDEALHLLPCVITQTASHITMESLWRLTDVITRNVPGIGMDERKTYWSLLHRMKLKSSMFLDILSQDLPKATDRDADELLQVSPRHLMYPQTG